MTADVATRQHLTFLRQNRDLVTEPVLIVGSRQYEFDEVAPATELQGLGFESVVGIDISEGPGVDLVSDICRDDFADANEARFSTVVSMELLTHVRDPFSAARSIQRLLAPGGVALLSEPVVRKISRIPLDNWRFTYSGMRTLFSELTFLDERAKIGLMRDHTDALWPYTESESLPEVAHERHRDETSLGFALRRVHRRLLARGVFRLSRLLPEVSIFSVGVKQSQVGF